MAEKLRERISQIDVKKRILPLLGYVLTIFLLVGSLLGLWIVRYVKIIITFFILYKINLPLGMLEKDVFSSFSKQKKTVPKEIFRIIIAMIPIIGVYVFEKTDNLFYLVTILAIISILIAMFYYFHFLNLKEFNDPMSSLILKYGYNSQTRRLTLSKEFYRKWAIGWYKTFSKTTKLFKLFLFLFTSAIFVLSLLLEFFLLWVIILLDIAFYGIMVIWFIEYNLNIFKGKSIKKVIKEIPEKIKNRFKERNEKKEESSPTKMFYNLPNLGAYTSTKGLVHIMLIVICLASIAIVFRIIFNFYSSLFLTITPTMTYCLFIFIILAKRTPRLLVVKKKYPKNNLKILALPYGGLKFIIFAFIELIFVWMPVSGWFYILSARNSITLFNIWICILPFLTIFNISLVLFCLYKTFRRSKISTYKKDVMKDPLRVVSSFILI